MNYAVGKQTTGKAKEVLAGIAEKIYKKEVIERQKIHRISIYSIEIYCVLSFTLKPLLVSDKR